MLLHPASRIPPDCAAQAAQGPRRSCRAGRGRALPQHLSAAFHTRPLLADGQPRCQQSTAHPRARVHLRLPGLAMLSTPALGPSVLLGRLTEPIPGAKRRWSAQPRPVLERFQADTGLSHVLPCSRRTRSVGCVGRAPDAPLGKHRDPSSGIRRLPGPGRAWPPWGVQSPPRTQGPAAARGLWQPFPSATAPARTGHLRRALLHRQSPPASPPRGFQSAPWGSPNAKH